MIGSRDGTLSSVLGRRFALDPLGPDRFRIADTLTDLHFLTDATGTAELQMIAEGRRIGTYRRVPFAAPSGAELTDYVGSYHSDEVAAECAIERQGDGLVWRRLRSDDTPLIPTLIDGFSTESGTRFRFQRDGQGAVDRVVVSTYRVRGVVFRKLAADGSGRALSPH